MNLGLASPFDTAASGYDASFTQRPLGRLLRAAVWREIEPLFGAGDRVLELGCGTGEDAVVLARKGVHVTATDRSSAMLGVAAEKVRAAGVGDRVRLARLDVSEKGALARVEAPGTASFDGAFSNFGALNCVPGRRSVAEGLAARLSPGAPVALVLMGPVCPWEIGWHLVRLRPRDAVRRLGGGTTARVGDPPRSVQVWYPSARRLRREFAPWFRHRTTVGIGVVLPPPYLEPIVAGRPGLAARLASWDRRLGGRLPGRWLHDHYLLVLERR